ncbi:Zn-dependent protease (includes SpoIVFB) [Kytococcus aerolatus]|uniref:Zinc metalloprotease n=2 Tax=Kytococcus aerolatus TaxID=592308 RepID=A0A212T240_9MICO|nr:Zn-dependent protease (includes SpoIVFB) [Kytococcus aerolatus]
MADSLGAGTDTYPEPMNDRNGWRIGTVFGAPLYLGPTWPLLVVLIVVLNGSQLTDALGAPLAYALGLAYAVMLVLSVLVHELAHAAAARSRGHRVHGIHLTLIGGHTVHEGDNSPWGNAWVAIAGPLASLALAALGLLALLLLDPTGVLHYVLLGLVWVNGLVGVFNMLPGLPLDGGHALASAVWAMTGDRGTGLRVAGWSGRVLAVLVLVLVAVMVGTGGGIVYALWGGLLAWIMWQGASQALQLGAIRQRYSRHSTASVVHPAVGIPQEAPVAALEQVDGFPVPVRVITTDEQGDAVGLVDPSALALVPAGERASTPLRAVHRVVEGEWTVDLPHGADLTQLLEALGGRPLEQAAVREPGGWTPEGRPLPPRITGLATHGSLTEGMRRNDATRHGA